MAICPECDFDEIETEELEEGDKVSCPECGKNLVLIGPDEVDFVDGDDVDDDEDEDLDEEEEEDDDEEDEEEEKEDVDE
jgi:ssDNA-binding Zn-finger/Zn-ribbon topoisomerase 1